jgi:hypothetical protein
MPRKMRKLTLTREHVERVHRVVEDNGMPPGIQPQTDADLEAKGTIQFAHENAKEFLRKSASDLSLKTGALENVATTSKDSSILPRAIRLYSRRPDKRHVPAAMDAAQNLLAHRNHSAIIRCAAPAARDRGLRAVVESRGSMRIIPLPTGPTVGCPHGLD